MKFSLIIGTYQRREELQLLFLSLEKQTYKNFEVILCDQNNEGFLEDIISEFGLKFHILHLRTERGLSRARNEGLKVYSGEILAFPDDDCFYPPDLLNNIREYFINNPSIDGISCKVESSDKGIYEQRFPKLSCFITKNNVFNTVSSFTLFLRKHVVKENGFFNPSLGVGSGTPLGSGEETDYVLRAIQKGFKFYYLKDLTVYHPSKDAKLSGFTKKDLERTRSYNRGYAYLLKKYNYPFIYCVKALIRPLGGAFLALVRLEFRRFIYQLFKFYGRLEIFLKI